MELESPTVERAIVVTPYLSRSLWRPYLPGLDEPAASTVRVGEIAVVGLATEGGFSGGRVRPPDVGRRLLAGFELVASARAHVHALPLSSRRADGVSTKRSRAFGSPISSRGSSCSDRRVNGLGPRRWLASPW